MVYLCLKRIAQALESLIAMHYASPSVYVLFHLLSLDKNVIDHAFPYNCPIGLYFLFGHSVDEVVPIYGRHACLSSNFAMFLVLTAFLLQGGLICNNVTDFFGKMFLLVWNTHL